MAAGIPIFTHLGLDHFIGEDAGDVRLNGGLLPGIIQGVRIGTALRLDAAQMVSGAMRAQPLGFEVPRARVTLALTSEPAGFASIADQVAGLVSGGNASPPGEDNTCYGKARALDSLQRAVDLDGNPVRYRLTNVHCQARGMTEVWFSRLDTSESHEDTVTAVCEFTAVETHSFERLRGQAQDRASEAEINALNLADEDVP